MKQIRRYVKQRHMSPDVKILFHLYGIWLLYILCQNISGGSPVESTFFVVNKKCIKKHFSTRHFAMRILL